MAYQETVTRSYGSRLGSSIKGIGGGLLMLAIGTVLLWWNEGRAVKTEKMLNEVEDVAVSVEDVSRVDSEYDGQLIHAIAATTTTDSLFDPMFDVGVVAVKLDRKVEYYQWVEDVKETKKDKIGGSEEIVKTYTYKKNWVKAPVSSADFHDPEYRDSNKVLMQLSNESQVAENVNFGAYRLPEFLIRSISGKKNLNINLPESQIKQINELVIPAATGKSVEMYKLDLVREIKNRANQMMTQAREVMDSVAADSVANSYAQNQNDVDSQYEFVHQKGNTLYLGRSEGVPQVGDVRITFTYVAPGKASVIAKTQGDTFVNYVAKNGKKFAVLTMGESSLEEMMENQHAGNNLILWVIRIVGILIIIGAFKAIFAPLPMLLKVLPFLANIVQVGINLVCSILGIAWSLLVIGIAWIFYRPVLGIILLVLAAAGVFFLVKRSRDKKITQAASGRAEKKDEKEAAKPAEIEEKTAEKE